MLEEAIKQFLMLCQQDPVLVEFAQKRSISTQFVIPDRNLEFTLAFGDGEVKTHQGAPEQPVDFTVKMDEKTFTLVMTGKMDATTAAMSGRIQYKGNISKGMLLQRLIKDMIRLYIQVSTQNG